MPRQCIIPSDKTLTLLKMYNLLQYRGKRAGRPRIKSNAGDHYQNQIKLDHTMLLNAQRKSQLKLSTVNTRSVREKKTTDLLQHISEENV